MNTSEGVCVVSDSVLLVMIFKPDFKGTKRNILKWHKILQRRMSWKGNKG